MKYRWKFLMVIALSAVIFAVVIMTMPSWKGRVQTFLGKKGERPKKVKPIKESFRQVKILPVDRLSVRRHIVTNLHKALKQGDFTRAAFLNSLLAQEAFQHAYRFLKAWEKMRDPETGLVPRDPPPSKAYWNPKDAAADLFPFLLLACQYLDKTNEWLWLNALANERKICGPMPCTISFQPTKVIEEKLNLVIFGASEFAKDGLLPLIERSGRGPWFVRLEEIAQAIIEASPVNTKKGKIPSSNCEVNGNMLQVLSRLYWATQKDEYLQMAEQIAEAYLFDILPNNQFLPAMYWNFDKGEPVRSRLRFRDHGSEIIPGLVELYVLEKTQGRSQAALYREPLKKMLDLILVVGRTKDGLWYNDVDVKTHKPLGTAVIDTWGYILNAYLMFDIAEGTSIYREEIKRTMRAVATYKSFPWEGTSPDGYADSIESMLYLLAMVDIPEGHQWVDDEIEVMFHMHSQSSFAEKYYLDGNSIRTSLLYAMYKTQGAMIDPWREDLYLGAAYDKKKKELYVHLSVENQWKGVLKLDLPRHRMILNLPFEYPRLNATPEWFVVEPQKTYLVVNLNTGKKSSHLGQSLANGLAITMDAKESPLYLKISEK